jgi:cytochrome b561
MQACIGSRICENSPHEIRKVAGISGKLPMNNGWKNTDSAYGWPAIAFHWLMLLLIVAVYVTMNIKSFFPRGGAERAALANWHYTLGLLVFVLVWLRLLVRASGTMPVIEPVLPAWQARFAHIAHGLLYALMISLPVLGWLTLSAKGKPVAILGMELPALVSESKSLAKWFKDIHETIANTGYFVIGLHAAAALYHHYVRRDNTLRLMLPSRKAH